jgi:hypothetical protein
VVEISDLAAVRSLRTGLAERTITAFRAQGIKLMEPHAPSDTGRGPWGQ